ncbi:type II secretion system F family protein [Paraburkholderia sp.]|jgi:tight adherence protein C|uniref:type II secretion system F family protein n=1 Tax=Paraburkholderia sp. TaxID=1926495 RepID=UPI002F3ED647
MSQANLQLLFDLVMLLALLSALAVMWMVKHGGTRGKVAERLRANTSNSRPDSGALDTDATEDGATRRFLRRLTAIGERLPLFDAKYRMKLQREMVRGGFRSANATSILLAIKFFTGLACAVAIVIFGAHLPLGSYPMFRALFMLGAFVVGMIIPEYILKFRSTRRRNAMAQCLPDALDLLVICTNAGNSLGVSIRRVADELATICPPLSEEFGLAADELQVSGDSGRALSGLAERIDLPSIRALISTLTQSMRYGTPITTALRTLSRTERLAHIVSLEEKAAKLAPKMVVPMMLFILPPVVVIAAGPAVIQLMNFFATQ